MDAFIQAVVERHGRLDVMVKNAATYSGTALLETEPEQREHVMRVNLQGMFYGCKRAVPRRAASGGRGPADQPWVTPLPATG